MNAVPHVSVWASIFPRFATVALPEPAMVVTTATRAKAATATAPAIPAGSQKQLVHGLGRGLVIVLQDPNGYLDSIPDGSTLPAGSGLLVESCSQAAPDRASYVRVLATPVLAASFVATQAVPKVITPAELAAIRISADAAYAAAAQRAAALATAGEAE